MLQVATFALPADQDKANEFLKTHVPEARVRTTFNPSANETVDQIKQKSAELINLCEELKAKDPRLAAIAQPQALYVPLLSPFINKYTARVHHPFMGVWTINRNALAWSLV
jgi:hypothetical protein